MILQNFLFPQGDICSAPKMYYITSKDVYYDEIQKSFLFQKHGVLDTFSYFNGFSIGKWKKYTIIDNLQLNIEFKGCIHLNIVTRDYINSKKETLKTVLKTLTLNSDERTVKSFDISLNNLTGIISFELESISEVSYFYNASYETTLNIEELEPIMIGIGICTFKREEFVKHNINLFNRCLIENKDSPLYHNLLVYISDNGKSLSVEELNSEYIKIFPNKNLGGAGGFTRSMIELFKVRKEKPITHILLMDDDVRIDPASIEKTYNFIRLLNDEYKSAFIGGGMLRLDRMNIQSESGDYFYNNTHSPIKPNYNLENPVYILKNEIPETINHFGWWYCCMPIGVMNGGRNLPLPLFIKRDDIEYGLRTGNQFITLNGICVWHETFDSKYSAYLTYYYYRNLLILKSIHRKQTPIKNVICDIRKDIIKNLICYRYKEAELSLIGIQDFLKGFDWFKRQDAEKLNNKILSMGYTKTPIEKIDFKFAQYLYEQSLNKKKIGNYKVRIKSILKHLLKPGKNKVIIPAGKVLFEQCNGASEILNYEEVSKTGFITKYKREDFIHILKLYRKTIRLLKKKYVKVSNEFSSRYEELTNLDFWNDYLNRDAPVDSYFSVLTPKGNTKKQLKKTIKQYGKCFLALLARLFALLLFLVPIKRNRIMLCVNKRLGFTCNPKYIALKLQKLYGKKLDLYWVTDFPNSCKEVSELGIKVIKANSLTHYFKYIRTRFYITNDSFPCWALHRLGQKWMNTWHAGMNYKHIGIDYLQDQSFISKCIFKMANRAPNFYLAGSQFFIDDTSKSFSFKEKRFINTGLPRNDVMFGNHEDLREKVLKCYDIPKEEKLLLFAPTFRRGFVSSTYDLDFNLLKRKLENKFGGKWQILFRDHYFIGNKSKSYQDCINVSTYPDMQELMVASDILISDYSSCLWDFSLQRKPCFVYASDLNYYQNNDRTLAYPIEKWPYPISVSNEELIKNISCFNESEYLNKLENHFKENGCFDRGESSDIVVKIIAKYCLKRE